MPRSNCEKPVKYNIARDQRVGGQVQGRCESLWITGDLCRPTTGFVKVTNINIKISVLVTFVSELCNYLPTGKYNAVFQKKKIRK